MCVCVCVRVCVCVLKNPLNNIWHKVLFMGYQVTLCTPLTRPFAINVLWRKKSPEAYTYVRTK